MAVTAESELRPLIHREIYFSNAAHSAGRGSNGADGGVGGTIEISVDEDNTHLLFAVQCNVSGGDGGAPGHHGKPGREGVRGIGGARYQW